MDDHAGVGRDFKTDPVEINSENNHVHLLVNFRPKVAPAKLVNSLKGVSSRRMRQDGALARIPVARVNH
jgi:putative transposase